MATVVWHHTGALLADVLFRGDSVTAQLFVVLQVTGSTRPGLLRQGFIVINDNAKPQTAAGLAAGYGASARRLWTTLPKVFISHAAISVSLVPIAADADMTKAVASWLQTCIIDFFYAGVEALMTTWRFDVWHTICYPCATYTLKKFSIRECFCPLFRRVRKTAKNDY